jgi:hypothetical protein
MKMRASRSHISFNVFHSHIFQYYNLQLKKVYTARNMCEIVSVFILLCSVNPSPNYGEPITYDVLLSVERLQWWSVTSLSLGKPTDQWRTAVESRPEPSEEQVI